MIVIFTLSFNQKFHLGFGKNDKELNLNWAFKLKEKTMTTITIITTVLNNKDLITHKKYKNTHTCFELVVLQEKK